MPGRSLPSFRIAIVEQGAEIRRIKCFVLHVREIGFDIGAVSYTHLTLPIVLMSLAGLVVGWRIHSSVGQAVAGYALMFAFAFAVIWVGVLLAAALKTPEGVQGVAFVFVFPITFVAST